MSKMSFDRVCTRFETVTERVSRIPMSTADLVDAIGFCAQSQTFSLPEMKEDVKASGRRLLMLLGYTVLNCTLYQHQLNEFLFYFFTS